MDTVIVSNEFTIALIDPASVSRLSSASGITNAGIAGLVARTTAYLPVLR